MNINSILIIGAGNLGSKIALRSALSGFETYVFDSSQEVLDTLKASFPGTLKKLVQNKLVEEDYDPQWVDRLHFISKLKGSIEYVDMVNESVTEDLPLKEKVWKEIGPMCKASCLLTTNTSYLLPSQLAEISTKPSRFLSFHFHDVFYSRVVDIMPHEGTDADLIPVLMKVGRQLKQVPVWVKKEWPGYIFNTMLMALLGAAGRLLSHEVASHHDIDRSWMVNFHMPMGPFGIMDQIGLDTAWHVVKSRNDEASQRFANLLKGYVDQGKLGQKSGEGFYSYPQPAYQQAEFLNQFED